MNIAVIFITLCSFAKGAKSELAEFVRTTEAYRSAAVVEMDVGKKVTSELLGKETNYTGKIYLSNNRFRWEEVSPDKNLIVFDGQWLWSIQYPSKEFPGPIQVAKSEVSKKNQQQILVLTLVDPKNIKKHFLVKKRDPSGKSKVFELKTKENLLNLNEVIVELNENKIEKISYHDEVGNLTVMQFSNIKFKKKNSSKLFKYTPEKGAQVTHL